jgi:hypothetical protein
MQAPPHAKPKIARSSRWSPAGPPRSEVRSESTAPLSIRCATLALRTDVARATVTARTAELCRAATVEPRRSRRPSSEPVHDPGGTPWRASSARPERRQRLAASDRLSAEQVKGGYGLCGSAKYLNLDNTLRTRVDALSRAGRRVYGRTVAGRSDRRGLPRAVK